MSEICEHFRNFLYAKDLKFTPERKTVLEEVFAIHDHFEAEDLLFKIKSKGKRVSRGTIYRTLKLLVECDLVREVAFVEKHLHYEHVYGHKHHEHLICESCGKVINFFQEDLEATLNNLCREHDFQMKSHKIEVVGRCKRCQVGSVKQLKQEDGEA